MVVQIPKLDVGADIGRGLGAAGAGLAQNKLLQSQLSQLPDQIRKMESRTPLDLYNMLYQNLGGTAKGKQMIPQLLPQVIATAERLPAPGAQPQPGQPAAPGQEPSFGISEHPNEPTPFAAPASMESRGPIETDATTQGELGQPPQPVDRQHLSPAVHQKPQVNVTPQGMELLRNPEMTETQDREALRSYYSAEPALSAEQRAARIQQLQQNQNLTFEQANKRVEDEFQGIKDKFNQQREKFQREEALVSDTLEGFDDRLSTRIGQRDAQFNTMARKIAESFALQKDAKGNPKFTPRNAQDKAIEEVDRFDKGMTETKAKGPLTLTQSALTSSKNKKYEELRPLKKRAERYGIKDYMYNQMIKSDILSPSETASFLYPPDQSTIDQVKKIPKIRNFEEPDVEFSIPSVAESSKKREQAVEMASDLIKDYGPNDSLVSLRSMLVDRGFQHKDFNDAMEKAQEKGWVPSDLHEQEETRLSLVPKFSLADYWSGRAKSFTQFIQNFVLGEKN